MAPKRLVAAFLFVWGAAAWGGEEPLTLYWYDRPPLLYWEDGQMRGLMFDPAERVMRGAGIPFVWRGVPYSRAQVAIRENREKACAVGWFRSPEREGFAQFSAAFYYGQAMVAAVRRDMPAAEPITIRDFLRAPGLRMIQKQDLFLGAYMHAAVHEMLAESQIFSTPAGISPILKMIESGRGDFTIVPKEEMDYLLKTVFTDGRLRVLAFSDAPRSEGRYFMCSKSVPADWMARITAAATAETKGSR